MPSPCRVYNTIHRISKKPVHKLYVLTTIALASFLFGLAVWPGGNLRYTTRARIHVDINPSTLRQYGNQTIDQEFVDATIDAIFPDDEQIINTARSVGIGDLLQSHGTGSLSVLDRLRKRLIVHATRGAELGKSVVTFEFECPNPQAGVQFVADLADTLVTSFNRRSAQQNDLINEKETRLARALSAVERRESNNEFDRQVSGIGMSLAKRTGSNRVSVRTVSNTREATGSKGIENRFFEYPPERSSSTKQSQDHLNHQHVQGNATGRQLGGTNPVALSKKLSKYRDSVRLSRLEAETELRAAESQLEAARVRSAAKSSIASAARVIAHAGGQPTQAQLIVLGSISLTLGSLCAWFHWPNPRHQVFNSVDEVERTLNVPVIGSMTGTQWNTERSLFAEAKPRLTSLVSVSEWLIVLTFCLVALTSLSDRIFLSRLLNEPLAAFSHLVTLWFS